MKIINPVMKNKIVKFIADVRSKTSKWSEYDRRKIVIGIILFNAILLSIVIYFRFAVYDEKLFLHETVMMSEILKQGKWIGNYGVGVHGFIFKLPIALIFILTGPNIYIATFFHVILASFTLWIFYLLIENNFKLKNWSIVAVIMLITNYTFFSYSTTFHREIPVLFSFILFIYYLLKDNKKLLLLGFLLLLILEAKEYVFFTILVPLLGYYFLVSYSGIKSFIKSIFTAFRNFLLILVPSCIYFYLMFYTSLLPVNMFDASFLGLTTSGFSYQIRHASPENALSDMSSYTNNNKSYKVAEEEIEDKDESLLSTFLSVSILGLGYLEKFLYITNFSLQGVHLLILIPALTSSIYLFKKWKETDKRFIFPNLFYWEYLFIYMIRASHQRYILTVIPYTIIFFIYFFYLSIKEWDKFKKWFIWSLILSLIATVSSTFYQELSDIKSLFNVATSYVVLILLSLLVYFSKRRAFLINLIFLFTISASLFVSSYAIFTKNQIYKSLKWGINGEADIIAEMLEPEDVVFIDCQSSVNSEFTYLINIFRANNYLPIEWHWKLDESVINREIHAIDIVPNFYYTLDPSDLETFKVNLKEKQINKIVLMRSHISDDTFPLEEYIEVFDNEEWLKLQEINELKNKDIYIYSVDESRI
ncbi:MAG: hypothetical protein ABIC57_02015 [bacterium]